MWKIGCLTLKRTLQPDAICELGAEPRLAPHWPARVVTSELGPGPSEQPAALPAPLGCENNGKHVCRYCFPTLMVFSHSHIHQGANWGSVEPTEAGMESNDWLYAYAALLINI